MKEAEFFSGTMVVIPNWPFFGVAQLPFVTLCLNVCRQRSLHKANLPLLNCSTNQFSRTCVGKRKQLQPPLVVEEGNYPDWPDGDRGSRREDWSTVFNAAFQ
jgi:hypothetical protein